MENNLASLNKLDEGSHSPIQKITAWERFIEVYPEDNPYMEQARDRIKGLYELAEARKREEYFSKFVKRDLSKNNSPEQNKAKDVYSEGSESSPLAPVSFEEDKAELPAEASAPVEVNYKTRGFAP